MEKVLVTGAGGFMGSHLVEFLLDKGYEVYGTYFTPTTDISLINKNVKLKKLDIRDKEGVKKIIQEIKPSRIFHLAAQSYPTVSWQKPNHTIEVNVKGTVNLFESIKELKEQDNSYDPTVIMACSSAEYGFVTEDEVPVKESHELRPLHPYGVSKVGQELLTYQYFKNNNIKGITARIFNTTGPRKVNDVCSDFTKRIVMIEKRLSNVFLHGNLETKRAITDVRDLIEALWLLSEKGVPGESYNLSGEKAYKTGDILDTLLKRTEVEIMHKQDPKLMRSTDEPIIIGDASKLKHATGWYQKIPIEKTLKDMLDFWRNSIKGDLDGR